MDNTPHPWRCPHCWGLNITPADTTRCVICGKTPVLNLMGGFDETAHDEGEDTKDG